MALRKKFIQVEIPSINESVGVLGEPEQLDKKTIKLDLSRKMRGKGVEAIFKIQHKDKKLTAYPKKIQLIKSYIQRMMRKRSSYVEDSFQTSCKDIRAIVKPFLITRKKVSRAVRKNLRNTAKEFIIDYLKNKNYLTVCEDIFEGELQKQLLPKLKKVYPLSFCDIRIFETKELEKADFSSQKPEQTKEEVKQEAEEEKQEKTKKKTPSKIKKTKK
jgi:ribosomal protein S3AE